MDSEAIQALAPAIVVAVAFVVYCLSRVIRSDMPLASKWLWAVATIAFIPLGGVAYLLFARGSSGSLPDIPLSPPLPRVPRQALEGIGYPVTSRGLTKSYGSTRALDGIDLDVPGGSAYGLVGPNGAGKTTLIGILAGLRKASSGSMELPERGVAVMPDTPVFDPWLSAREVVQLAASLTGQELSAGRVGETLAEVSLLEAAEMKVGSFSRGMLQRLGIAVATVGDPRVLLLDEPCSALDPAGRKDVLDLVGRLKGGSTVLFSSHILADVERVCDRVGVLHQGRLLYQGSLEGLSSSRLSAAYRIRCRVLEDSVVEALQAARFVGAVHRSGDELRVEVTSLDEAEKGLVRVLADAGAAVVEMEPLGRGLEEAFLELTQTSPLDPGGGR